MTIMTSLSNIARHEGDPRVLRAGSSSLGTSDRLAKALGWFSLGLGAAELLAPHQLARSLGMEGKENLIRAYGLREISAGLLTLSINKQAGLWSRELGDGLDIATLLMALRADNPKRQNVMVALGLVVGVTVLDALVARATTLRHTRLRGQQRLYRERSGFPQGVRKARGGARDFNMPRDKKAAPTLAFQATGSRRTRSNAIRGGKSRRVEEASVTAK